VADTETRDFALPVLANHKIKVKTRPGQRACNEKNEKGKLCNGHLKHWFYKTDVKEQACGDIAQALGPDAELYRCEFCKTLYLPHPEDPRGQNVAGKGQLSDFGLTLPPKDKEPQPPK
jgi:hypothetical protein